MTARILVIKLGALGDFVQALPAFQAIRQHHASAEITLLTTPPFEALAKACGWFDRIWVDTRPRFWQPRGWWTLCQRLRSAAFERVYDLQTSDRTGWYFRLLWGVAPEWSGIAPGCSHPHGNPARDCLHTVDRLAEQLSVAGLVAVPPVDLNWLDADITRLALPGRFALLIPGGAAHRPEKRWPAAHYGDFARRLAGSGVVPVVVGGADEQGVVESILGDCPDAVSLVGRTTLLEIGGVARRAAAAIGNDTGPMHIAAAVGCPSLVLFSDASDPALCAQRGPDVTIFRRPRLRDLSVDEVEAAVRLR